VGACAVQIFNGQQHIAGGGDIKRDRAGALDEIVAAAIEIDRSGGEGRIDGDRAIGGDDGGKCDFIIASLGPSRFFDERKLACRDFQSKIR